MRFDLLVGPLSAVNRFVDVFAAQQQSPDAVESACEGQIATLLRIDLPDGISRRSGVGSDPTRVRPPVGVALPQAAACQTILERGFSTALFDGSICASGRAYIWLGGRSRMLTRASRIGFHMAYDKNTGQRAGTENAMLGSYLTKSWPQYNVNWRIVANHQSARTDDLKDYMRGPQAQDAGS